MSSILSTSACGVGTQTTSLPDCPTWGSKLVPDWVGVCAIEHALAAMMSDASAASRTYLNAVIGFLLRAVGGSVRRKNCNAKSRVLKPRRPARRLFWAIIRPLEPLELTKFDDQDRQPREVLRGETGG